MRTSSDTSALRAVLIGSDDPEIIALEARLRAAQLAADVGALDGLIADELLFTGPDGRLGTKAQDLEGHRSGVVRFLEHEPTELRIRRLGADAAIVALRARLAVELNGSVVRGTYRYTRIRAREAGTWRVAGGHASAIGGRATVRIGILGGRHAERTNPGSRDRRRDGSRCRLTLAGQEQARGSHGGRQRGVPGDSAVASQRPYIAAR